MRTVVFFDPYPIVGLAFAQILKDQADQIQTRTACSLDGLYGLSKELTPDLLVLTINTPKEKNPLPVLDQCRRIFPAIPVILYDEGHFESQFDKWLKIGASGYLLKIESEGILVQCIETVLAGGKFLSPGAFSQYLEPAAADVAMAAPKLGRQESKIAWYLAEGKSTTWIARQLGRKPCTISTVKRRVFAKFKVNNVIDLRSILVTVRSSIEASSSRKLNSSNIAHMPLAAV
jgi:DNA-binding NarL/FixJ family response regulator